jgi:DNA helicase-4
MSESKQLNPSWFWRLLGFKSGSIDISEKGITLHKDNKNYFIDNHSFVKKGLVTGGWPSFLVFNTTEGEVKFGPLSHAKATQAYEWLQSFWYKEIFPEINKTFKSLQRRLSSRYIRSSQWPLIINDAQVALARFVEPPTEGLVDDKTSHPFHKINTYAHMGRDKLDDYRKEYLVRKKKKFKKYFENIEVHPLTEDQIEACIIDEDNNLVLAGAGTGKTSTMVGRAGFLLESKQAKPEDMLMLAYGKIASQEMQDRMKERINREDVDISTFHKLGMNILSEVEGGQPNISKYAEDNETKSSVFKQDVSRWIDELLEEDSYKDKVIKYFEDYLFVEKSPFDFKSQGEYFSYVEDDDIRTFKGEKVKGHGERIVANFLFMMGIEYEYEAEYKVKTTTKNYRQYKPDFYLPKHDIYIEHFGVDRSGNTAPYIDKDVYIDGARWKRQLHEKNKTKLVETYFYEHIEGILKNKLTERLKAHGVECNPIPNNEIIETLREHKEITEFSNLMANIIKRYKANWFDQDKLNRKINSSPYKKHLNIALELMMPLRNRYEKILRDNDEIDFEDMIGKALDYVLDGSFKPQWKYIMVDEFQDISDPRARLVQALKEKSSNCSLFCVGDDWQAIYRFTGSDISFTTGFSEYFGATQFTKLKKTFRFNNSIAEVSSQFVLKNPFQTKKSITTLTSVDNPAVSILRESSKVVAGDNEELNITLRKIARYSDGKNSVYILGRYVQVDKVLQVISRRERKASILILGRYGFTLPNSEEMDLHKHTHPTLKINKHTMHTSKGKEADYVIVLGLQSGKHGFPSEKTTNPLLDALLPTPEDFEFAEERRLFYVAITRARKRSYLVADMATSSSFVNELIKVDYEIELNEFDITDEQRIIQTFHCAECETGVMQRRVNTNTQETFYGCSHWTLCKYSENGCSKCGGRMKYTNDKDGKYKVCSDCNNWIPICTSCGGDMRIRDSKFKSGQFWGCSHYFGPEDSLSCRYTIDPSKETPPRGYMNIVKAISSTQQNTYVKSNKTENIWDDKEFIDRQDALAYASKLAKARTSIVNVVEKKGYWLVELKK